MKVIIIELREMAEGGHMDCLFVHVASSWEKAEAWMRNSKDYQYRGDHAAPWWWWCSEDEVDNPDTLIDGDMRMYSWDGQQIDYQPIGGYKKPNE